MSQNLVYITNNKLHYKNYELYTLAFYILVIHSYYILYRNFNNNNYITIFIYFVLLLLSYIRYNKFSYYICYVYLLVTVFFINNNNNIKETMSLEQSVDQRRGTMRSELESVNEGGGSSQATPCETYILKRLGQQELNISTPTYNTNAPSGSISTTITSTTAPPALDTQLFE